MSLGVVYLIVLVVSVVCGFAGIKSPNSKTNILAGAVMLAGVAYAGVKYSWFHLLGLVGITLVGLNMFNAIALIRSNRMEEKERIDKIFSFDEEDETEDKEV